MWIFFTSLASITAITSDLIIGMIYSSILGCLFGFLGFHLRQLLISKKRSLIVIKKINLSLFPLGFGQKQTSKLFGEVMLWLGIAIIAFPVLKGWQMLSLISPVFVYLLLTKGSGVPILEANADKKWGNNKKYQTYKSETPFFPRIFKNKF